MRLLMWTGAVVAVLGVALAAVLFAFLGAVLHGAFYIIEAALAGGVAGIAWWWVRDRRAEQAALAAETQLLAVEAIACHQPAPRRRQARLRRWRHACGRAAQRIRGSAERDPAVDVEQLRTYRERQRRDVDEGVSL